MRYAERESASRRQIGNAGIASDRDCTRDRWNSARVVLKEIHSTMLLSLLLLELVSTAGPITMIDRFGDAS